MIRLQYITSSRSRLAVVGTHGLLLRTGQPMFALVDYPNLDIVTITVLDRSEETMQQCTVNLSSCDES